MLKANSKKVLDIVASQTKRNATQAYKDVHPNVGDKTAQIQAHLLMKKPEAQIYLASHIDKARETIVDLMTSSQKDDIKLRAATDVLDRSHGKAKQQIDVETRTVSLSIDLTGALNSLDHDQAQLPSQ
jgi:hypothetical protein